MSEIKKLETDLNYCIAVSKDIIVHNQLTFEKAADFLKTASELSKKIDESFKPIIDKAHAAHKEAIAQRDKHLSPVKEAIATIKNKISLYLLEQENKRKEEVRKQQIEAEEKARKEREKLEEKAKKAEEKGNIEKAEALKEQASQVEAIIPTVAPTVQKVNGVSARVIWKARVINFEALSNDYKVANQQLLDAVARSSKGQQKITGVEMYSETSTVLR